MNSDNKKGLFTDGSESVSPRVTAVPLSDVDTHAPGEAKKAGVGAGFFAVAGVVALYSSFFLFFFLAELIAEWLPRWAAFLIVFVLMLVIAGVAAFLGLQKVKKVGKPEKTIQSVQELKTVIPSSGNASRNPSHATADGLYT